MQRRIIKQGHNTLTITLPSKWAQKLNLKAGDEIDLSEQHGSILLNGKQHLEKKSTTIDVTNLRIPMVWRYFQSAYREGYDEIKITYDPTKQYEGAYNYYTTQFAYEKMGDKTKQNPAIEMIQEIVNRFINVEIIDTGKDYCTVCEMSELTSKEFDNSLRRIFLLIIELFETTIDLIKQNRIGDINVCKTLHHMDTNIDRFIDYCCRINNKINDSSFQKNKPLIFSTLFLLELLGDEFKYIGTHLAKSKKNITEIADFAEDIKRHFERYYNIFYKFDRKEVEKFGEADFEIYNNHFKRKESANKDANGIRRHLMQISKFTFCLMELRIGMEF
jgi:antitoxin component of MazEF toxin-antitoxin module